MTELTITEKSALDKLPSELRPFVEARMGRPVSKLNDIELKAKCLDLISYSFAEQAIYNVEPKILAFQRDELFKELRNVSAFKNLTFEEVKIAFNLGIRQESGAFFGMCAKTYNQFLKHYAQKEERNRGMRMFLDDVNKPKVTEKPIAIKFIEDAAATIKAFNDYKETGKMPFIPSANYYYLWKEVGLIKWSDEQRKEIKLKARAAYAEELRNKRMKREVRQADYEAALNSLDTNPTVARKAREIGLRMFFDICIQTNFDLAKTLNDISNERKKNSGSGNI